MRIRNIEQSISARNKENIMLPPGGASVRFLDDPIL